MGMSASADLAFGVALGAEDNPYYTYNDDYDAVDHEGNLLTDDQVEEYDDDPGDLGEYLARRANLENPWRAHPEVDEMGYEKYKDWLTGAGQWFNKLTDEWSDAKLRLEKESPVEFAFAGSPGYDATQYVLVLKDKKYRRHAYWGAEPIELPEAPSPEEIEEAVTFCKANGLPDFSTATWLLSASYG